MSQPTRPHRPHRKPSIPVVREVGQWHDDGFVIDAEPPRRSSRVSSAPAPKRAPLWRRILNVGAVVISSLVALALIISTYSAHINPASHPIAAVLSMVFAGCLWVALFVFGLDLWLFRKAAWIPGLAMLACSGAIASYMPLHIPNWGLNADERERSFTLMTYNVFMFIENELGDVPFNRQLAYILERQPDVACIQEAVYLSPESGNHIRQYQIDSLRLVYPYVMTQGHDFAILSKFPVEPINLDFPSSKFQSGGMAAWRLNIHGRVVNIFSVHLRSFSLTPTDKGAYRDLVKLDSPSRSDLQDAKSSILPKIMQAGVERSHQIEYLNKYLKRYGGNNAIVVGDFNDPDNSYAVNSVCSQSRMRQAYADAGFWPLPTYNSNSLYFRIDHVLYRGDMRAYAIKRGSLRASDHYPLTTTFLFDAK